MLAAFHWLRQLPEIWPRAAASEPQIPHWFEVAALLRVRVPLFEFAAFRVSFPPAPERALKPEHSVSVSPVFPIAAEPDAAELWERP